MQYTALLCSNIMYHASIDLFVNAQLCDYSLSSRQLSIKLNEISSDGWHGK